MPWTLGLPEVSRGEITWLELESNGSFVLEQKLKDVSTPRGVTRSRSRTVHVASNSFDNKKSPSLVECQRYGFRPPAFPETLIQFRIRTRDAVTRSGTTVIVSTACSMETILEHWQVVNEQLMPLCRRAGLDPTTHVANFSTQRWLEFLVFQVSAIARHEKKMKEKNATSPRGKEPDALEDSRKKGRERRSLLTNSLQSDLLTINQVRRKSNGSPFRFSDPWRATTPSSGPLKRDQIARLLENPAKLPLFFDLTESVKRAHSCVLVSCAVDQTASSFAGQRRKRTLHPGVLLLTDGHLCFSWQSSQAAKLKLKLAEVEDISYNEEGDAQAPNCLSVLHRSRKQFLFLGFEDHPEVIDEVIAAWTAHLEKQQKVLRRRLKTQTLVYTTTDHSLPKLLAFFAKAGRKRSKEIAVIPTTTKLPLFSLAPFVQSAANSEECLLMSSPHLDIPVAGKFYLTTDGATFVASGHSLMVSMPFMSTGALQCRAPTEFTETEVKLKNFAHPITLSNLSARLQRAWENAWTTAVSQEQVLNQQYHSEFPDEHDSPGLVELKQRYIATQLHDDGQANQIYWDLYCETHADLLLRTDILQRLIYMGIPNAHRGRWWGWLAGITEKRKGLDEVPYGYLVAHFGDMQSISTLEISRDACRSFPEHDYYTDGDGCAVLESILCAYSWRNSAIGYCQSMNLISALLLLYMSEEDAFMVLSIICEDLLPNYFTPTMDGSLTDQQVLRSLIEEYLPNIHQKFIALNAPIAVLTLPWFLCLFIRTIPWDASVRVLDLFFAFGRKILFQMALGIFRLAQDIVLACTDSIEVIFSLKEFLTTLDADTLVNAAFEFEGLSLEHIDELWCQHHPDILKDIAEAKLDESAVSPVGSPLSSSPSDRPVPVVVEPVCISTEEDSSPSQEDFSPPLRSKVSRKKSFQLRQTTEELRSMTSASSRNSTHMPSGLVSLMEGFTKEVQASDLEHSASKVRRVRSNHFSSSLEYSPMPAAFATQASSHRRIKSVSKQ